MDDEQQAAHDARVKESVRFMPSWNEVLTKTPDEAYGPVRAEKDRLRKLNREEEKRN